MRQTISISDGFFCDGHCYLLTSASLGGSGLTAQELEEILFEESDEKTTQQLLEKGVCLPVCFPGDCALDGATEFVLGDLTEAEERAWMARLRWKLNVPCGKLILSCGCLADELEPAINGEKPDPNSEFYQSIDVPPAEYLVEIYAYLSSQTVQVELDDDRDEYDEEDLEDDEEFTEIAAEYRDYDGAAYIIRLAPLGGESLSLPEIEGGWFQKFEFRGALKLN